MTRPKRGQVWWVDLQPSKGDEIGKVRPAVVVSGDELGVLAVKVVVPLTSLGPKKVGKAWLVPIEATEANGLARDSVADALQLRGVSLERFKSRLGEICEDDMAEIVAAVALIIGLE